MLLPRDFARLTDVLRRTVSVARDCEIAIEIDPRTFTHEAVFALKDGGVTRASVGMQDFEPRVQKAVGRVQSFEQTARAVDWLRDAGIVNINLDLMYGLPYQTVETLAATARRSRALDPVRIALFGYAHVPWMKRHQKFHYRRLQAVALARQTPRGQCPVGGGAERRTAEVRIPVQEVIAVLDKS